MVNIVYRIELVEGDDWSVVERLVDFNSGSSFLTGLKSVKDSKYEDPVAAQTLLDDIKRQKRVIVRLPSSKVSDYLLYYSVDKKRLKLARISAYSAHFIEKGKLMQFWNDYFFRNKIYKGTLARTSLRGIDVLLGSPLYASTSFNEYILKADFVVEEMPDLKEFVELDEKVDAYHGVINSY